MQDPVRVALSLVGIVIIIIGAYYATYYIGKKASGQSRIRNIGRNRHINLLERFAISKDKSFCIVEIAGKIYLVGVTSQSMTLLDTLSAEEFAELAAEGDDMALLNTMPGGLYGSKPVAKLASFIARRMGRTTGKERSMDAERETFADSMRAAHEKNTSGQPDRVKAERPDSSEVE